MKIVLIGNGKVGSNIASQLVREGHDVTVVDQKSEKLKKIQDSQDVLCIEGNGATVEVQKDANVNKAGLLIATTPNDETNMLCCLIAKKLGAERTISRVRNPEYFGQIELIKDDLSLSMVINPERMTADEIFRVLVFSAASKVEVFSKGRVELVEYKLSENSSLAGRTLAQIYSEVKIKHLVCAVQRSSKDGTQVFIPSGGFVLQPGDRISIASSHKYLEKFFRSTGLFKNKIKNVMIIGGGKIAFYLASQLLEIGMSVKIIDNNMERCRQLAEDLDKASIICGDGTDQELLLEEGLHDTDAFVSLTGIDEVNIITALYAKKNSDAKVVAKINRESYIDLTSQLGLDSIISPKYITATGILSYVRSLENAQSSDIEALYHLAGDNVEAIEFKVKDNINGLVGIPLSRVELKKDILICAIIRKRNVIIPGGSDAIELGDSVVVVSKDHHFSEIRDILD